MFKKIILTFVLLIFAQQEFYAMESPPEGKQNPEEKKQKEFWEKWNNYCNYCYRDSGDYHSILWWLWAITDNVPIQYGNSKVWEHGEAYYGLSNGIGFFPSILNFGWVKIGIGDFHINVINAITNYIKIYVAIKYDYYFSLIHEKKNEHKNSVWFDSLKWWLFYTILTDTQLFSFKFFNCVKIKIISIGAIVVSKIDENLIDNEGTAWYFKFRFSDNEQLLTVPHLFFVLSTRIEINIPELINYLKKK